MRVLGTMCLMMLLAGCVSGPSCSGRLVPINRPVTVAPRVAPNAPPSTTGVRTGRSPRT